MEANFAAEERRFKKGEIICNKGEYKREMYNILLGQVEVYSGYGTPEQKQVEELGEGEFLNVISFLEARPRKTVAVALETTVVDVITKENFESFFERRPAKIMQLLQNLSARIRHLTADYLEVCRRLEEHPEIEKIKEEHHDWYEQHEEIYQTIFRMVSQKD